MRHHAPGAERRRAACRPGATPRPRRAHPAAGGLQGQAARRAARAEGRDRGAGEVEPRSRGERAAVREPAEPLLPDNLESREGKGDDGAADRDAAGEDDLRLGQRQRDLSQQPGRLVPRALEPGAKKTVELIVRADEAGEFCVKGSALADKGLTAAAEACTTFLGVSALTVDVTDREDPVVVGGKTSYVVLIRNQGSAPVTNLKVRAFLAANLTLEKTQPLETTKAEEKGGLALSFAPLPKLEANSQVTYEVFVVAGQPAGPTRFRALISADQLENGDIIEEENTTIFQDIPEPGRK